MSFLLFQGGIIPGQIDLPENLPSGSYQLRAYAPLMLNQPDFLFSKKNYSLWKKNWKGMLKNNR